MISFFVCLLFNISMENLSPKMHARRCFYCFWFMCCKFLLSLALTVGILSATFVVMPGPWFFFLFFERTHQKLYLKQRPAIQALIPTGYMYLLLKKKCLRANCFLTYMYMYHNRIIIYIKVSALFCYCLWCDL